MNHDKLLHQLELHEGYRKHPYEDTVGKITVGIGRNLDDVGISREEALYLLEHDVRKAMEHLEHYPWFTTLSDVRQRVVVDMTFNLGARRFSMFKRMIKALEEQDYEEAAKEMLDSRWAVQVGSRATRLAKMMETDEDMI